MKKNLYVKKLHLFLIQGEEDLLFLTQSIILLILKKKSIKNRDSSINNNKFNDIQKKNNLRVKKN